MNKIIDIASIEELPQAVTFNEQVFYLTQKDGSYQLLSSVCPHQGGFVELRKDCFECPLHSWYFNFQGECTSARSQAMFSFELVEKEGALWLERQQLGAMREKNIVSAEARSKTLEDADITFRLLAHSTIEISTPDYTILTDPWLDGPAFLGSWYQYPKPISTKPQEIPDMIWISHEHSDHFHPQTLAHYEKSIPIYFPDFPNGRLPRLLEELGFTKLHAVKFGEEVQLAEDISLTAFEPKSLWNDSITLFQVRGANILNLNDAGVNPKVADCVPDIDVVLSSFSPGSSGYPLTWKNVSAEQAQAFYTKARAGMLKMLETSMELYRGAYILPYASHFILAHPQQRKFNSMVQKNTLDSVVDYFSDSEVEVLDILPGESWSSKSSSFKRIYTEKAKERLYTPEAVEKYAKKAFEQIVWENYHPKSSPLEPQQVKDYFLNFNHNHQIRLSEEILFRISALDSYEGEDVFTLDFQIQAGSIQCLEKQPDEDVDLWIGVPTNILAEVVRLDLSWDEAHVGYWCSFYRKQDVYNAEFWAMLQTPYYKKRMPQSETNSRFETVTKSTNIGQLLEQDGFYEKVLARAGMYCYTCGMAHKETIEQGALRHGIEGERLERLLVELNHL